MTKLDAAKEIGFFIQYNADELDKVQKESPPIYVAVVGVISALAKKYKITTPKTEPTPSAGVWRVKTRGELISEFGSDWRNNTNFGGSQFASAMDGSLGKVLTEGQVNDFLNIGKFMDNKFTFTKNMVTDKPLPSTQQPLPTLADYKKILRMFKDADQFVYEELKPGKRIEESRELSWKYWDRMKKYIFDFAKQEGLPTLMFDMPQWAYDELENENNHRLNAFLSLVGWFGEKYVTMYTEFYESQPNSYFSPAVITDFRSEYENPKQTQPEPPKLSKTQQAKQDLKPEDLIGRLMRNEREKKRWHIKDVTRSNKKTVSVETIDANGMKGKVRIGYTVAIDLLNGKEFKGWFLEPLTSISPTSSAPVPKSPTVVNVAKNTGNRPSPTQSASEMPSGFVAKGNDGEWYEVRQNKAGVKQWKKVKQETPFEEMTQEQLLNRANEIQAAMERFEEGEPEYEELKTELETINLYIID